MAVLHNIRVDQGATYKLTLTYTPAKDLTGFSGRGQIKTRYEDTSPLGVFDVTVTDAAAGVVQVTLPADALATLTFKANKPDDYYHAVYDVELFTADDAEVIRLINGVALISPEVTK